MSFFCDFAHFHPASWICKSFSQVQRSQRPVSHRWGQHRLPQEIAQVVGQHEQLQPHLAARRGPSRDIPSLFAASNRL
jgi:hypothetical protein